VVAWHAAVLDGKVNVSGCFALDPKIYNFTCDNELMMIGLMVKTKMRGFRDEF
jgi:hypothetical protein